MSERHGSSTLMSESLKSLLSAAVTPCQLNRGRIMSGWLVIQPYSGWVALIGCDGFPLHEVGRAVADATLGFSRLSLPQHRASLKSGHLAGDRGPAPMDRTFALVPLFEPPGNFSRLRGHASTKTGKRYGLLRKKPTLVLLLPGGGRKLCVR